MIKKNRMTPLFIVASIVIAPLVFWFLRRGARPRQNEERDEVDPATNSLNPATLNAVLDLPLSPEEVPPKFEESPLATSLPADAAQLLNDAALSSHAEPATFGTAPVIDNNSLADHTKPLEVLAPPETELPPKPEDLPPATSDIDAAQLPNEAKVSLLVEPAILDAPHPGDKNSLSAWANPLEMLPTPEEVLPPNRGDLPVAGWSPVDATPSPSVAETPLHVEPVILEAAHFANTISPLVETNETATTLEDEEQALQQAASVADKYQYDEATLRAAATIEAMPSPEGLLPVDTAELRGEPEVEQPLEGSAAPAAPDVRDQLSDLSFEPISLVSNGIGLLPHAETSTGDEESAGADLPASDPHSPVAEPFDDVPTPNEGSVVEREHLYRPPPQRAPRQTARTTVQSAPRSTDLALEIRVRLKFDRFGFCEIRFLPERKTDMDNEIEVTIGGTRLQLVAQEEWYEDLAFEKIGDRLRRGLELKGQLADQRRTRWLLTGRNIYVLANHQRASGFVSTTRLVLGRSHVLLCTAEVLQQVEGALTDAGCQGYTKLDETHGLPSGWIGLRGVTPSKAAPLEPGIDPFYAVKPAPDIDLGLEGGVCLRNSIWLEGFPPQIKLLGDASLPVKVLIDGQEAGLAADGSWTVDGYDQLGEHVVYCEGLSCSRSYSIEAPPDVWEEWPAYHFGQAEICGPLVRILPQAAGRRLFSVPMSNPLLLGAEPGQIFRCLPRSVKNWKGFVPFDVVWALPAQPYICDKKTARIIQFSQTPMVLPSSRKHVLGWCAAILEASRKGLLIENASSEGTVLWKEYKIAARNMWRAAR
jgi:hypothetical protein